MSKRRRQSRSRTPAASSDPTFPALSAPDPASAAVPGLARPSAPVPGEACPPGIGYGGGAGQKSILLFCF